jgi:hypothetical protein
VLFNDVPYGKIILTPFSTKPLKLLPGYPVPIPGVVFLTAGSTFPATFDYGLLKIVHENLPVIPHEGYQITRFIKIKVCPVCCSLFLWWLWHLFDFVLEFFDCRRTDR